MDKLLLYLLLFCTGVASAQVVNIPDANFRNKLLAANTTNNIAKNSIGASIKIDADNDNYIEQNEVDEVYELNVSASSITDMTGIQEFDDLEVLNCEGNNITTLTLIALDDLETLYCGSNINLSTLNITGLSSLTGLYCSGNNLSAIDFTGVTALLWLECNDNNFTILDVTSLSDLRELKCSSNGMTNLSVAGLSNLRLLECNDNHLTALDLLGLAHLESFICHQNNFTALDFTGLEYLVSVNCSENQITTLDFSGNPDFDELDCFQNALTFINLKNGALHTYDGTTAPNNWYGNPDLEFICIDEDEESIVNAILAANGLTVNFNTYCSFVPGGDYNIITGTVLFDGNNDGCNTGDAPQPFIKIGVDDGMGTTDANFTDGMGNYSFYALAGTFTIEPQLEHSSYFTITPSASNVTFPIADNSIEADDFCIAANGVHPDVEVVIEPLISAVPGGQATYKVVYKNKGNQVVSGSVTLSCDQDLIDYAYVNPLPDNISSGTYTWDYSGLKPFENREINVTLDINSSTDTPPVNVGDVLLFSSTITSDSGDDTPQDNSFDFDQVAVGASVPNNIVCIEGDTESPDAIGNYLHYAVNFTNTGTEQVTSVVVKHDFDPAQFDAGSVQILNSSHTAKARINGNRVEFIMQNASLATDSHGNILFKVKTRPSITQGQMVTNNARIFFDYKFPVETNDANTVFQTLSTGDFEKDNSVMIYPNPAKTVVTITSDNSVKRIELYDVQGRVLETGIVNDIRATIDLTSRAAGMYFVKVTTEKGVNVKKIVHE